MVEVLEELDASAATAPGEVERGDRAGRAGRGRGRGGRNLSRFSRSVRDALDALGRIEDAGGRLVSATEQFGDDATGRMTRNILLSVAEMERERAKAGFAAAVGSAVERGIHVAGDIPLGYVAGRTAG